MNRLCHLANTLGSNIFESSRHGHEVALLNYGDKNGLDDWIKSNWNLLLPYVELGNFNYYHTTEPEYFSAPHAKNIVHKLATGDILCNLDADNYIMSGFCEFIVDSFKNNENIIILSEPKDSDGNDGTCGKIAVKKEHFYNINGYDEGIYEGWGWDDVNFHHRSKTFNKLQVLMCPIHLNKVIPHSNDVRVANFRIKDYIKTQKESIERINRIHEQKQFVANIGKEWGKATVTKNLDQILFV